MIDILFIVTNNRLVSPRLETRGRVREEDIGIGDGV